jgi:hypothetical protein
MNWSFIGQTLRFSATAAPVGKFATNSRAVPPTIARASPAVGSFKTNIQKSSTLRIEAITDLAHPQTATTTIDQFGQAKTVF